MKLLTQPADSETMQGQVSNEELMTVDEFAHTLKVKPRTVYTWLWQGRVPAELVVRLAGGRAIRFKRGATRKWIEHGTPGPKARRIDYANGKKDEVAHA